MVESYETDSNDNDGNGNGNNNIELELIPELNQSDIVSSFVFNRKVNSVILSLNHAYNEKIVICPINSRQWIRTTNNFTKQLAKKGVSNQHHVLDLCDTLDLNYETILQFDQMEAEGEDEEDDEEDDEERIEDTLMDMYHFKTMNDTREVYYYDESKGIYVGGGEIIIETLAESMTDGKITTGIVNEVMNHIRRRTYTNRAEFDSGKPEILNLQNGLLNVDTLEFEGHSYEHLSLVQSPIRYDPKAKCPNILKFLAEVLHPQDIFTAMQVIGYCLYKSAEYEKAVMLVGPGANGKGVFIKIIEALVGLENTSHVTLQDLDNDRFAAAGLYCKMVDTFADLKSQKLSSTGIFKTLVSGDSIRAQHKFCKPFSFRNYATLIFSANKIPETDDKSYAYYRRWLILAFEKVFEDEAKDVKLIEKLTTPEELSGLLNLALIAFKQLRKDNGFKDVSVEKVRKKYEEKSNIVKAFLEANGSINLEAPEYYTLATDLYSEYVKFCKEKHERPLDMSVFGKKLAESEIEKKRITYYGQKETCYIGVKLLADLRGKNECLQ